jgi:hypothetical protein
MADKLTLSDFGVFLAEICEFLKKREKTLRD